MLDIRWIRENAGALDSALASRGLPARSPEILALDREHRRLTTELQEMQTRRNELSKRIGALKGRGGDAAPAVEEVAALKARAPVVEGRLKEAADGISEILAGLPNVPDADVPVGADEGANATLREWGERPAFGFEARDHAELAGAAGLLDLERASRMSGARFAVTRGPLARMERALASFMLDVHTGEFGYTEVSPPLLVRDAAMFGTGQLPKFSEDLFRTGDGHWLVPTAEVPLTNLVAGEILGEGDLPMRFAANTPCFRSEAGAAGRDTRGMLRQHQFYKVELVSVCHPDGSRDEHERMTGCAEEILRRLGLPYRVVSLATGDLGFSARKTYDLEVWLPGQGRYREISSCSDCGAFQARRMGARFRPEGRKGTEFVHTLNGSGVAVGRAMIAVIENFQMRDGSVAVPEALRPYMGGMERLPGGRA